MAKKNETQLQRYQRRFKECAARLSSTGFISQGSISHRMMTCGKKTCACHTDEARRHGPYAYWTTKIKGKTVCRLLKPEEAKLVQEWIGNRKELDRITREMLELSEKIAPLLLEPQPERSTARQRKKSRARST